MKRKPPVDLPTAMKTAAELKAMRDAVYGHVLSDEAWLKILDKWREDEAWLTEQFNKLQA